VSYFKYSRKNQNKIRLSTAMVLKEESFHDESLSSVYQGNKNHKITEHRILAILLKKKI